MCDVCVSKFNITTRVKVECSQCSASACSSCYKKYLSETNDVPVCMFCKEVFDIEYFAKHYSRTWVSKNLRKHLVNIMVRQEEALIRDQVEVIQNYKHCDELMSQVHELEQQRRALLREAKSIRASMELYKEMIDQYRHENYQVNLRDVDTSSTTSLASLHFKYKCFSETCQGYLHNWTCDACSTEYCEECFQVKSSEHICTQQDIQTAAHLKTTKPCPSCGEGLSKVDGCDQFFCTVCKAAFDWKTGRIITNMRYFDNPHYFQWQRESSGSVNRHPSDIPPVVHDMDAIENNVRNVLSRLSRPKRSYDADSELSRYAILEDICRVIRRLENARIAHMNTTSLDNTDITNRLEYATGKTSEKTFRKIVWDSAKTRHRAKGIQDYLTRVLLGITNALRDMSIENVKSVIASSIYAYTRERYVDHYKYIYSVSFTMPRLYLGTHLSAVVQRISESKDHTLKNIDSIESYIETIP